MVAFFLCVCAIDDEKQTLEQKLDHMIDVSFGHDERGDHFVGKVEAPQQLHLRRNQTHKL